MFRTPTHRDEEDRSFYANRYRQGYTTDLPDEAQLRVLMSQKFAPIGKDYARFIEVLTALGAAPGQRLLDFGCSWGYGSWLFAQNGFVVDSFELPGPRATYAREHLNVNVLPSMGAAVQGTYDIFFSSHVLEHLPNVSEAVRNAMNLLRTGGLFVAFVPNGSDHHRKSNPGPWSKSWGQVHPNLLDNQYFEALFPNSPIYLSSNPYDLGQISRWTADQARTIGRLDGDELLLIVRKGDSR
jgi:2-polyprenyl-3-methyl-5-hydroxy-6-metoxy-1,4-benzoquinol methylase